MFHHLKQHGSLEVLRVKKIRDINTYLWKDWEWKISEISTQIFGSTESEKKYEISTQIFGRTKSEKDTRYQQRSLEVLSEKDTRYQQRSLEVLSEKDTRYQQRSLEVLTVKKLRDINIDLWKYWEWKRYEVSSSWTVLKYTCTTLD